MVANCARGSWNRTVNSPFDRVKSYENFVSWTRNFTILRLKRRPVLETPVNQKPRESNR